MNSKEQSKKEVDVVTVATKDQVTIHEPKTKVDLTKYLENQQFRFDAVFDESSSNELVYKYIRRRLVKHCVKSELLVLQILGEVHLSFRLMYRHLVFGCYSDYIHFLLTLFLRIH